MGVKFWNRITVLWVVVIVVLLLALGLSACLTSGNGKVHCYPDTSRVGVSCV